MAYKANLVIDQGSDFSTTVVLTDEADVALDLSNYTATAKLRKHYASANALTFSTQFDSNLLTISLSANQTSSIESGKYVYDVELVDVTSNTTTRIVEGIALITPETTR